MLTTFSGRRASQDEWELGQFVALMRERGVRKYVELGAREGDTFFHVVTELGLNGPEDMSIAVDLPGGLWGKASTEGQLRKVRNHLVDAGYFAAVFIDNSHDPRLVDILRRSGPYDAVLIDGDHTYEGVKADWEAWREHAPIIAFHDIVGEGQFERVTRRGVEVPRLWAEIKASGANVVEFVSPGSAMGIGVVIV